MVMPLDEGGNIVGQHQLVNGRGPAGPVCKESPGAVAVQPAPLVERRFIDATPPGSENMVRKHELVFRSALFKGPLEPLILGNSVGDIPHVRAFDSRPVVVVHTNRILPIRIDRDKEGIPPGP